MSEVAGPARAGRHHPARSVADAVVATVKYSQVLAIGPEVEEIKTPASVACGQTVNLDADIKDLDADLVSTRWYVDDVLLAAAVSSIQVDDTITLRVVATDARGAVSSLQQVVSCI